MFNHGRAAYIIPSLMQPRNERPLPAALCLGVLSLWTILILDESLSAQEAPGQNKPAARKAEAQESAKDSPGPEIPWDNDKLKGVPQIVKRLYRLKKSGQWDRERLPRLCELCIADGNPKLKMYATWYQALIAGHNKDEARGKKKLREAIDLGYLNVTEMEESEELAGIRGDPEVRGWIGGLSRKLRDRMVNNFQKGCDINFAGAATQTSRIAWGTGLKALDGGSLIATGRPSVLIVARTHHDPLERQIPDLKRIQEKTPVSLVFWELKPMDPRRIQSAKDYVASLKRRFDFSASAGMIGRKEYLELRHIVEGHLETASKAKEKLEDEEKETFREGLPFLLFLDSNGVPVDSKQGVQAAWQIDYLNQKIAQLPAAAVPEPPREEPKATLPPAPPVEEKKPEPDSPKAGEPKAEPAK